MSPRKRKTECQLCNSPMRSAARAMHDLAAREAEIAACCGVSEPTVHYHFTKCALRETEPETDVDGETLSATDADLRRLLTDASETYTSATLRGNDVAAASSLGVRLRVLSEIGRRERLAIEVESDQCKPQEPSGRCDAHSRFVMSYLDFLNREREQWEAELARRREAEKIQSEQWAQEFEARCKAAKNTEKGDTVQ